MIQVLAIDDEPLALLQLQKMIERVPEFELVAACSDASEAQKVLETRKVDVIFTDINMPDMSGLDLVRSLISSPIIIFTTAYSQYALDGYKLNALDYLLKPFGWIEFQRVATKVKQQYELLHPAETKMEEEPEEENSIPAEGERIEGDILFAKVDYRIVRISISEIKYIESQSEYLRFFMANGTSIMVLMSIKRIAELLPTDRFVRIHRSYVVNMSHVQEVAKLRIKMDADTYLPIGDLYKEEVMSYINSRIIGK